MSKLDYDPTDLRREKTRHEDAVRNSEATRASHDLALRSVMGTAEGRQVIWRLLEEAAPFQTSFAQNAMVMGLNEGRKQLGYFMLNELDRVCPDLRRLMEDEVGG